MLQINMEDVIGVLQTCQKYLIPSAIALVIGQSVDKPSQPKVSEGKIV